MVSKGHALSRDELIRVLTVYQGVATADGALDGSTLIDSGLIGVNDYVTSKTILIMSGDAINETSMATVFNAVTGQISVLPIFSARITVGTLFRIINLSPGSAMALIVDIITDTFDLANAILKLTETGGSLTATALEQTVYINNTPLGVFEPRKVKIDCSNMAWGDIVILRWYERIVSGGELVLKDELELRDVQTSRIKDIELEPNRFGVQVTLQQTAGAAFRVFPWEVLYEV